MNAETGRTLLPQLEKKLIIRGDLRSQTGYARAGRALIPLLKEKGFQVVGVDIHPNPDDNAAGFPAPLLAHDGELFDYVAGCDHQPLVLHYTGVDDFVHIPGAYNIGAFYWETESIPFNRSWPVVLGMMEEIWAPTSFLADFARRCGFSRSISVVTWPHRFGETGVSDKKSAVTGPIWFFGGEAAGRAGRKVVDATLDEIRARSRDMFLAVQSLASRKGLPIFLSEWRRFREARKGDDVLLLRLSFRHSTLDTEDEKAKFSTYLDQAGFGGTTPNVAVIPTQQTDDALRSLYQAADAIVSASYGEGFGGPVIEALTENRPVITVRHTGLADLISEDYPLAIPSFPVSVGLRGNLPVYPPTATWYLPEPGKITEALCRFSGMSSKERKSIAALACRSAASFCSTDRVREQLNLALSGYLSRITFGCDPVS